MGELGGVLLFGILFFMLYSLSRWTERRLDALEQAMTYDLEKTTLRMISEVQRAFADLNRRVTAIEKKLSEQQDRSA